MLRDITIGQHFPGNSVLHRCDPRLKLVATIAYIVVLFVAPTDRFSVYDFYAPCKKYEKSSAVTSEQSVEGGQFSVGESCIRTGDGSGTF